MSEQLEIITRWGIACDPISIQLNDMGIHIKREKLFDHIKESLNHLSVSGLFTDSSIGALRIRANKALTKEISEALNEMSNDQYLFMLKKLEKYNEQFK